jgi:hypothetical protein
MNTNASAENPGEKLFVIIKFPTIWYKPVRVILILVGVPAFQVMDEESIKVSKLKSNGVVGDPFATAGKTV